MVVWCCVASPRSPQFHTHSSAGSHTFDSRLNLGSNDPDATPRASQAFQHSYAIAITCSAYSAFIGHFSSEASQLYCQFSYLPRLPTVRCTFSDDSVMPQSLCSCSVTYQPQRYWLYLMDYLFQQHGLQNIQDKKKMADVSSFNKVHIIIRM